MMQFFRMKFLGVPTLVRYLAKVAIIALAYYVTGRLGLLLAIPPGYATAIWAPSGIALAGALLFGYQVWPGIVLGSFLVNVGTSFDATSFASILTSLLLPAIIGTGAALQACFGAFLVRRLIGFPNPLMEAEDVGKFLLLGGRHDLLQRHRPGPAARPGPR
jgi:integral membrane sensor domain MASE1